MGWALYRKTKLTEMRPWTPGECLDDISIAQDLQPREGGFVARDPSNPHDQWYISPEFFRDNYEKTVKQRAPDLLPHQQRVVDEKVELDGKLEKLHEFIVSPLSAFSALPPVEQDLLKSQRLLMQRYSITLAARLSQWGLIPPLNLALPVFEYALADLGFATDGQGLPVALHRGPFTYEALRETTFAFMEPFDRDAMFINGLSQQKSQASPKKAETAAWRNLALLANATAAALDADLLV
jgi:hypothetical protein